MRVRLRSAAERAEQRAAAAEQQRIVRRWDRRALAAAAPVRLSPEDEQRARRLAGDLGISLDRPVVAVEAGCRPDLLNDAGRLLAREGYHVVQFRASPALTVTERYLLQTSAFVICRSAELQRAALEAHTPSLRLDARDPFTAYPVRADSVFTLAAAIDLDTGRTLAIDELLTERYFRNARNYGYRGSSATVIASAIAEMMEGVRGGWTDSAAQARFRRAVTDAGAALGGCVRHLVEWDAAGGFVGDGRLARVQAERAS